MRPRPKIRIRAEQKTERDSIMNAKTQNKTAAALESAAAVFTVAYYAILCMRTLRGASRACA